MRELGLWDVDEGLARSFADVEALIAQCRFRNCRHTSEPGCAVRAAVDSGDIEPTRYDSYLRLYEKSAQFKQWEHK